MKTSNEQPDPPESLLSKERKAFSAAFSGLWGTWKSERHFQFHVIVAVLVGVVAWWLKCEAWEWSILLICIAQVLSLELINTALERVVDLAQPDWHPLAKQAKDCAAAGVFVSALAAICVGVILLGPKLLAMLA